MLLFKKTLHLLEFHAETSVGSIVSVDKFTWTLFASAVYGTSLRTFTRQ